MLPSFSQPLGLPLFSALVSTGFGAGALGAGCLALRFRPIEDVLAAEAMEAAVAAGVANTAFCADFRCRVGYQL